MGKCEFRPRTATREEKRQANEALGRSFCKTLAELITNSDSSAKRKHSLPQASGLVDLMLRLPKGAQLDTSSLKTELCGEAAKRRIRIDVVTSQAHGRPKNEIVVADEAQGMSAKGLRTALEDIGGDRKDLAGGMVGRNLFGRGLSDVMRAHEEPVVWTFDNKQLTRAEGEWRSEGWTIALTDTAKPSHKQFEGSFLEPSTTGTAVRFIVKNKKFHIPDPPYIVGRLANFYMLRLIASDPNVELILNQYRTAGVQVEPVTYDFPVGQIIESFSRTFDPGEGIDPLTVEFLVVRSERKLDGAGPDRDGRENGLIIVDELDAVYDLTFADPDYERAEFLRQVFGIVRVNGLRNVLEAHLNSPDSPTSPLRIDRDGFNRDHEFSGLLLDFLAKELRPCYERERKRLEQRDSGELSKETRRRIDEALRQVNKYFQEITERAGTGQGGEADVPLPPKEPVSFFPQSTKLTVDHQKRVVLLVRDDVVSEGCCILSSASDGFTVQPEMLNVYRTQSPRWTYHPNFFCFPFTISGALVGLHGTVDAIVECVGAESLTATLQIEDVLDEPLIAPPATMEFRPPVSTGRYNRRNNMVLYVNPTVIPSGHHVRFTIKKRVGAVNLIDASGDAVQQFDVRLDSSQHGVRGQKVLRVLVPWKGTSWNQHATVEARSKVGPDYITAQGRIRLDEPEPNDAGFFQRVEYDELDRDAPSMFAAGVITVNRLDPLNRIIFGSGATKEEARKEFDQRMSQDPKAQQRLASLLLEETTFRMVQQLYDDGKLPFPEKREIAVIHDEIDKHKFKLAPLIHSALVK